ncbi:hypothetical protein MD484_g5452, partial [Candolleomyces efflorescens]
MSGISPRRIRPKTSDITEFFRTSNLSSSSRHPDNDVSTQSQATTHTLDVPSTGSQHPSLAKKKSTRIPFLGRSRKKSNPNASDAGSASVHESDVGEPSSGYTSDRRQTVEISEPVPVPSTRLSILGVPKSPSQSLGSKLAAHFQPRSRKLSAVGYASPPQSTSNNTLAVPEPTTRGTSLDSGSSGARSPTPRAQPTITVSYSENLDEYKDLFTLPKQKKPSTQSPPSPDATPRQSNTPESEESPDATLRRDPRLASSIPAELPRRGSAPTILDSSRHRPSKNPPSEQPPKPPSKILRKPSTAEKGSQDSSSTPRSSDGKDSTRSSLSDKLPAPTVTVPKRVSVTPSTPAADYSAQQRLRMRQQLAASASDKPNKPPSMPLPSAPTPTPPGSSSGSRSASPATVPRSTRSRSRAGTVGSVSSITGSPLSQSTVPSDLKTDAKRESVEKLGGETPTLDLGSATAEQLREILAARTRQCEQLTAEKAALEKKVSQLEKEMSKKDHQIKGLMWLVANNKSPPATDFPPELALPSPPLKPPPEPELQKITPRMHFRRHHLSDDSGAESHPTSGAESLRSSETSGNESSSLRRGKGRRPFMLGDSSYNFYRAAVGKRLPPQKSLAPDSALPDVPNGRSSLSSVSLPSPSSSTSSLLPPSPSMTVSSLSAIPEAPSSLRISMNADATDSPVRSSNRISTSSMASSSTAASSAYAANLKRSRPPSIAQVLENSPRMDDVLEKLRPFQPTA